MSIKYIYRCIISAMLIMMLSFSIASGSIFEIKATSIDGGKISLSNYKGKVLLVVNTASRCGFTPQYKSLEKIYKKYKERDFVVLAFPSNDFRQELSTNEEIKDFCEVYELSLSLIHI